MNEDIQKYPIYALDNGRLFRVYNIHSTRDYNHYMYSMHHYILRKHYEDNNQWYKDRGIEQKLEKIREYCNNCNLKADFTACDVLQIIEGK